MRPKSWAHRILGSSRYAYGWYTVDVPGHPDWQYHVARVRGGGFLVIEYRGYTYPVCHFVRDLERVFELRDKSEIRDNGGDDA